MDANREKSNRSPNRHIKKSSFITQIENDRNMRIAQFQQSRKQLSYSTFLELQQVHIPFTPTSGQLQRKQRQVSPRNQEVNIDQTKLFRARSLKAITDHKPILQTAEKTTNDWTENMLRLKVEQMTFKYKTKISCLLKEMNISASQINRFSNISKTDDILNFLSLKVREKIVKSQLNEENLMKARSKSKEAYKDYEIQRQMLKKKLQEKQSFEKQLKNKLRDSQVYARELLNKVSQKEKEISLKMDELYHQKVTLAQQQKLISHLQQTCDTLQKQNKDNINQLSTESKDLITINKQLEKQNAQLAGIMDEFKDQIEQYKEKQNKLLEINKQLNEEVIRWRERYQDGPSITLEKEHSESNQAEGNMPFTPQSPSMKKSTLSMSNYGFAQNESGNSRRFSSTPAEIDNVRLLIKVQQLQKKNKQLSRDILNYANIKQSYEQNLAAVREQNYDASKGLDTGKIETYKQTYVDLEKAQLEAQYKKKIEEVAKDWKDKLYDIVHKYEDELQSVKEQLSKLQSQKEELEQKILALANQKYLVQRKLIQKEREAYDMAKVITNNTIYYPSKQKEDNSQSHSLLFSQTEIKPTLSHVTQILNQSPDRKMEDVENQHIIEQEFKEPGFVGLA